MYGTRKLYRAAVLKALFYARQRNSAIDRESGTDWQRSLAHMSTAELLRQLRRLVRVCSERDINLLYTNTVFKSSWECLPVLGETIVRRGKSQLAVVQPLISEYNSRRELFALLDDAEINDALIMVVDQFGDADNSVAIEVDGDSSTAGDSADQNQESGGDNAGTSYVPSIAANSVSVVQPGVLPSSSNGVPVNLAYPGTWKFVSDDESMHESDNSSVASVSTISLTRPSQHIVKVSSDESQTPGIICSETVDREVDFKENGESKIWVELEEEDDFEERGVRVETEEEEDEENPTASNRAAHDAGIAESVGEELVQEKKEEVEGVESEGAETLEITHVGPVGYDEEAATPHEESGEEEVQKFKEAGQEKIASMSSPDSAVWSPLNNLPTFSSNSGVFTEMTNEIPHNPAADPLFDRGELRDD